MRDGGSSTEAVLGVVLEALDRPAFVVGPALSIRYANAQGQALLGTDRLATLALIEAAIGKMRLDLPRRHTVRVIPIPCRTATLRLCVLDPVAHRSAGKDRLARAAKRFGLSPRQTAILGRVARGASNRQIGIELGCSLRTVEVHVSALLERTGAKNRTMLVALLNEL